jgi:hypothetical protein
MIDYEMYCKIRDHRDRQGLTITQTARALGLHPETVSKYSRSEDYKKRSGVKRGSRLDPQDVLPYSASMVARSMVIISSISFVVTFSAGIKRSTLGCGAFSNRPSGCRARAVSTIWLPTVSHVARLAIRTRNFAADSIGP